MKLNTIPQGNTLYILTRGKSFVCAVADQKAYVAITEKIPGLQVMARPLKSKEMGVAAGVMLAATGAASLGGLARSANMTKKRRHEIAMLANQARWGKKKKVKEAA